MIEEIYKSGLSHSFFLLETEIYDLRRLDLAELKINRKCINIRDDQIRYLYDTLLWIPTYIFRNRKELKGLDLYGDTIIKKDGAIIGRQLFTNWAKLFGGGPESFELTGSYTSIEGGSEPGHYQKLPINRNEFVKKLERLAFYCEEVIKSNDQKFILHLGI